MNGSRDEFREARELWKRARHGAPAGGHSPCPGPNELAAYLDGAAHGALRNAIEEHLRFCPTCVEAAAGVRALLRAGPAPVHSSVFEKAKGLVASPVADERSAGGIAALYHFFSLMRASAAWGAAAALIVAACAAGFTMGRETFPAPRADESALVSNGVPSSVVAEFGLLEQQFLRGDLS